MIEAAGGLVWRAGTRSDLEVLLIHRPGRRGWSFPKGKLEPGEAALEAALREVREETGLDCEPGPELGGTRYLDRRGRDKRVRYWTMVAISGRFRVNAEVDEVRWRPFDDAALRLAAPHDRVLLDALSDLLVAVR